MGYKFAPLVFSGLIPAGGGAASWKGAVDTEGDLPTVGNSDGDCAVVKATNTIYIWGSGKWNDTSLEEGSFGLASDPNAFAIVTDDTDPLIRRLQIQITPADATNPGAVSTTAQTFAGDKTFDDDIIVEGSIDAKGGIDSSTNTLTIGATADFINIGGAGATITINGDTTYEHVTDLVVKDKTITLNDGGGPASGFSSGIEVEEDGLITGYVQVSFDRDSWELKAPNQPGFAVISPGIGVITIDQSSHDPVTIAAIPNGLSLTGQELSIAEASAVDTGVVTTGTQTFAGDKTFNDNVAFVDVIDVQTGIDSTTGTLTLGGINTTTVNIGEPATGITSAVFYGPTDHGGYDITNFGNLSTNPTATQAVITTVTSSSTNPDYSGLIFSEANPEQADILYTAGGTLNLNSSQNLALTAPNFNVDSANVDIGQLGGTTDLIGGTVTLDSSIINLGQVGGITTSIEINANIDGNDFVLDNLSAITNTDFYATSVTTNDSVSGTLSSTTVSPGNDGAGLIFTNPGHEGSVVYTAGGNLNLYSTTSLTVDSPNIDIGQIGGTTDIVGTVTIEYNPVDPTDWAPAPTHVIEAIDQLAERFVEQDQVTNEPTGFPNRTDSVVLFNDGGGTPTFTIQPAVTSYDVYIRGKKYTKIAAETVTTVSHPSFPYAGNNYFYFDQNGDLQVTNTFTAAIIQQYAFISIVYWNPDTNSHTYFAEERHGLTMDGVTHSYLHTVFGARYLSGLALQNFTIGTGGANADAQFDVDQGSIRDEDILLQIAAQPQIPILYRLGSNSYWRKKTADTFPLIYSGTAGYTGANGRLPYNQFSGGSWSLTEVANNKYVLVHFFATNDKQNGVVGIQGIAEYDSMEAARTGANNEITSLSGLPFAEFVPIGTVLFQTANTFGNTPKADVIPVDGANYVDFRGTQLYTPAGTATTHGLLSGLGNDDHFQYLLADGTRTMGGALNMGTHQINNVVDPTSAQDAATKNYVDGKVADSITDGVTTIAPSQNAVFDALALKADDSVVVKSVNGVLPVANAVTIDTDDVSEGITNVYFTDSRAQTAVITQTITNGVTDKSPSEDAVFDALALKQDVGNYITDLTGEVTASGPGSVAATITANAVTNAKLAQMPASTLKGNNTGLTADPTDLSASDVRTLLSVLPSYSGDIPRTTFTALDNTIIADDVINLVFSNATVRGFDIILTVERNTTYAEYSIKGIQKGASWEISQDYIGDETGITFSITSAGQIQYTTTNTGYNADIKFKAITV